FEKNFPQAVVIKLEQNYRSCKNIIDAASCVIAHNQMRKDKTMWTKNVSGEVVQVVHCGSDLDEARFVAQEIKNLHAQYAYRQIAIFYRANAQSRLFEDSLRREGIPYRIVGSVMFYERKEVKDVLAYLRVVNNPQDDYALTRIINTPPRGVGVLTLRKLEDWAHEHNAPLSEVLAQVDQSKDDFNVRSGINLTAKAIKGLRQLNTLLQETRALAAQKAPLKVIFEKVLHESGLSEFYAAQQDQEAKARKENLQELEHALIQYELQDPAPTLAGFLELAALNTDQEVKPDAERGMVTLMTAHGAKGLEFGCVFLVGAEENTFPSYKSLLDVERGVEEERRLFYVAMTRAMQRLYISFAEGRLMFGTIHYNPPSRFIEEIPAPLRKLRRVSYGRFAQEVGDDEFSQCANVDDYDGIRQVRVEYHPSSYSSSVASASRRSSSRRPGAGLAFSSSSPSFARTTTATHLRPAKRQFGPAPGQKYWVGAKVEHKMLGRGTIVAVAGQGPKEKVMIRFKNGDLKRIMAALAPLSLA
ncbi:MAG: ATP-binding domain-containing protein, partial [Bacteriovoracaceae bacterium]|nr:ATP-binding domain-containing protein [Bacteriovoracaceae bacterium]